MPSFSRRFEWFHAGIDQLMPPSDIPHCAWSNLLLIYWTDDILMCWIGSEVKFCRAFSLPVFLSSLSSLSFLSFLSFCLIYICVFFLTCSSSYSSFWWLNYVEWFLELIWWSSRLNNLLTVLLLLVRENSVGASWYRAEIQSREMMASVKRSH